MEVWAYMGTFCHQWARDPLVDSKPTRGQASAGAGVPHSEMGPAVQPTLSRLVVTWHAVSDVWRYQLFAQPKHAIPIDTGSEAAEAFAYGSVAAQIAARV